MFISAGDPYWILFWFFSIIFTYEFPKINGRISKFFLVFKNYFLLYSYWYFDRKKIEDALKRRKGKCKMCGACCRNILGFFTCPFLNGNLCRIHKNGIDLYFVK